VAVLAFPAPNLEYLAWFCLVPGLLLMRAAPTLREAVTRGWWFGGGYMLAASYWLIPEIGPAVLLVAIAFGAIWTGMAAAAWLLLHQRITAWRAVAAVLVIPSYWLTGEWLRSWQGFGGPWAVFGATQWRHPVFLALAAVGGIWLVSFAIVAVNAGLAILLSAGRAGPALIGAAGAAVALAAGPVAYAVTGSPPVTGHLTVALVQPGIVHGPIQRGQPSQRLTARLRPDHPDLVVWGESSIGFDLNTAPRLLRQLRALSAAVGAQILVNQDSTPPGGRKSKVAVLIGPGGIDGRYVKTRLVPFGEYIPFRQALGWLTAISKAAPTQMVPGTGAHVMRITLPDGRHLIVGVLICFESAFPDMSRADAIHGARLIIYQTSDSTFQGTWALAQHASLGAVRAAETGRPVVQAALTGDSAAFDPRGREVAWASGSFRGVLLVRLGLPAAGALTPFDRLGDYVPWSAVGIAALAAIAALAGRRRRRGQGGTTKAVLAGQIEKGVGKERIRLPRPAGILWGVGHRHDPSGAAGDGSGETDPKQHARRGTAPDTDIHDGARRADGSTAATPHADA
jgi:apolipoprotein N-acyltransferase